PVREERNPMSSYKLVSFESAGEPRAGMVVNDNVFDIAALTGNPAYATMLGVLADWPAADARLRRAAEQSARVGGMPIGQVQRLAPLPKPGAVYCAGSHYADHALGMSTRHKRPVR